MHFRNQTPEGSASKSYGVQGTPKHLETQKEDPSTVGAGASGQKMKKGCNCQKSRCIKLYCECYANGVYCNDCNCIDCLNNGQNEHSRKHAIKSALEKNPAAFQPKISGIQVEPAAQEGITMKHNKGCACKKSHCLKKYCECFQAGILCTSICKCCDCHNVNSINLGSHRHDETAVGQNNLKDYYSKHQNQPQTRKQQILYKILLPLDTIENRLQQEVNRSNIMHSMEEDHLGKLSGVVKNELEGVASKIGVSQVATSLEESSKIENELGFSAFGRRNITGNGNRREQAPIGYTGSFMSTQRSNPNAIENELNETLNFTINPPRTPPRDHSQQTEERIIDELVCDEDENSQVFNIENVHKSQSSTKLTEYDVRVYAVLKQMLTSLKSVSDKVAANSGEHQ